jgi:hypothetical protein
VKFGRDYQFMVEGATGVHVINYPLTLQFDIVRSTCGDSNVGKFTVMNLAASSRKDIYMDRYATQIFRKIQLKAGYDSEPQLPLIFNGDIRQAFSYRNETEWVTEIEAFDVGHGRINGSINITLPKNWNSKQVIRTLIGTIPNASVGAIGDFKLTGTRAITLSGNSWDLLKQFTYGGMLFTDLMRINALQKSEYIPNDSGTILISSETGLIGTPRRYDGILEVEMIFEPRITVGQLVLVQSAETVVNGLYQVMGLHHRGLISGAFCGEARTTLSLFLGSKSLTPVPLAGASA